MTTLDIQRRLAALGFDPGPLDGIAGARTRAAVRAFQAERGLEVDGIVGPATAAELMASPGGGTPAHGSRTKPPMAALPWVDTAAALMGLAEGAGPKDNPVLLDWARNLDVAYPHDDIPWCGLFVAHCVGAALPDEPLPTNPLGARNWQRFGIDCPPQRGSVLVFWRGSRGGWLGHVGFYAGERTDAFRVLGGNQSDRVSHAWIAKQRLLASRWPATAPFLATGRVAASGDGGLSHDEA